MERVRGVILRARMPEAMVPAPPLMRNISESLVDALVELHDIDLEMNRLVGAIPSELGLLKSAPLLKLCRNMLEGAIPSELGMLRLNHLLIHDNLLTGMIPSELGLVNPTDFALHENLLSSTIPSELGLLRSTTTVYLHHNSLTGTIPSELGTLGTTERPTHVVAAFRL